MKRLFTVFFMAIFAMFTSLSGAYAQSTTGWTLNINADKPSPVPAGTEIEFTATVNNSDNFPTVPTSVTFTLPKSVKYNGLDVDSTIFSKCTPALPLGQELDVDTTITCEVRALQPQESVTAKIRLSPQEEGVVHFHGKIAENGAEQNRTITVNKGADLALSLKAPEQVKGGGKVAFTATVKNEGPYPSTSSTLTFPVPAGIVLDEPLQNGCTLSDNIVTCKTNQEIKPGESLDFGFSGQVTVGNSSNILIAAEVIAHSPLDPKVENNKALADMKVLAGIDVSLSKTRAPNGRVITGNPVDFTLTPQFAGDEPSQATIKDILPENYDFKGFGDLAGSGWACTLAGREVTCEYTQTAGSNYKTPIKINTTAIKATDEGTSVENIATITSKNEDPDYTGNNTARDGGVTIIDPAVDLEAHKSGPKDGLLVVGQEYEYVLTSRNIGNIGFFGELTITDHLPEGMTMISADTSTGWTCSPASVTGKADVVCTTNQYTKDNPLGVDAYSAPLKLKVKMTKSGEFSNGMTVSLPDDVKDINLKNNTVYIGGNAGSKDDKTLADLAVKKSVIGAAEVKAGEKIEFAIEIINYGDAEALQVVMDDRIENIVAGAIGGNAAVTFDVQAGNASGMMCEAPPSGAYYVNLKCRIEKLPVCKPGEDCPVVKVSAFAGKEGKQRNTAHIYSSKTPDDNPANNESFVDYNVTPVTDVTVLKSSPSQALGAHAGQGLVYTIAARVIDNGLSGADNVVITDKLPTGVRFVAIRPDEASCTTDLKEGDLVTATNNTITCTWARLENGTQKEVAVEVKPSTDQVGQILINNATVSTSTEETDKTNNAASASVKVLEPVLDLLVTKTDTVAGVQYDPVEKGLNTTYLITAKNDGPSDAYNVKIIDTFPASGFSFDKVEGESNGLICSPAGVTAGQAGGTLTCSIPVLKAGSEVQFKVQMKSLERGTYQNTVEVKSDETDKGYDRNPGNNKDNETTTVRVKSDVSVVKTANKKVVDLRESFTWTLTVKSHSGDGLEVAEDVVLTDTLPEGMVLTEAPRIVSGKGGSCTGVKGPRNITCELGDMEPDDVTVIELTTKIIDTKAEAMTNAASVTTKSFDKNPDNNTSRDSVTTVRGGTVSGKIFKDFNEDTKQDAGDAGVSGVTVTLTGIAKHDGEKLTFTLKTKPDGSYDFTGVPAGEYQVSYSNVPDSSKYKTGVSVPGNNKANGSHSTPVNNTTLGSIVIEEDKSSVENNFTLIPLPSVGLSKVAGAPVAVGDGSYTVEYKFTIKNLSQEPLKDISLTDVLTGDTQNFGTLSADAEPLPGFYKVQSVSTNSGYNGSDNQTLISNAVLQPNATLVATIVVRVNPEKPWKANPLVLTNQAEVTAVGEFSGKTNITDKSDNTPGGENHPDQNVPTTVKIVPDAKIELEKTGARVGGTGEITAGDVIEYTFKVTNAGKTPLFDVVVTDPKTDLVWTANTKIDQLAVGASNDTAFKATYVVKQSDIDSGTLKNTAKTEGAWGNFGGTPQTVTSTDKFDLPLSEPSLKFEKKLKQSDVKTPSVVGDKITYEFTVTNTGNTTLKNVVITDELADVVDAGAFNIGILKPKETKTVEAYYLLKLQDINAGQVINKALASGTYGPEDKKISTPPSEVKVPTYRDPKLTLVKALSSAVPEPAYAGDMLEWTVTATNDGNVTLTNIKLSDPLTDAEITPEALVSLEPGESGTFTVKAPIQQEHLNAGKVVNTAKADFDDPTGPQPPVDSNEVVTPLAHKPSIELVKTADISNVKEPAQIGDEVLYKFTIRNTGNVPLNGLELKDQLPDVILDAADMQHLENLTLQPVNAAKDNENETQFVVKGSYKLKVADINAGKVENTADVKGIPEFGDDTPVTDEDSVVETLKRNPSIKLVKTLEASSLPKPAKAGDIIKFNFAVHNTGNVTLEKIRIEDRVDDVQVINQSGWTGPLEPGEVNEDAFTATYALKQSDIDAGVFANTAQVYGSSVNGTPDDVTDISGTDLTNDDETIVELETSASIKIVKSETHTFSDPSKVDDVITYSFLVTNTGNLTLTNVIVEDPLVGLVPDMPFTIATLLPGDANAVTLTATYKVTQADIENGKVVNRATVTGDYVDPSDKTTKPVTPDVSEEIIVPLTQKPGIAVVKEANSKLTEPAEVGQEIEYTFTVHNTGNMVLNDVVLNDPLPGITPNSFNVGTMQSGEQQSFTATYAITEADIDAEKVVNQATVKGTYGDPTTPKEIEDPSGPTVDTDEPTIVPVMPPLPELKIIKEGQWNDANGNGYPEVGETIEFTFKVTNEGNALLNNVTVQDEGPLFAGQRGTNQLSAITPAPVTLKPGESQTFKATYPLSQTDIDAAAGIPDMVTNTAFAKGDQRNGKPYESEEDKAKVNLPATEPSLVKITKQAMLHQVRRGDRVPYIIKVENTSSSNAGPVHVIDTMPSGFRYVAETATVDGNATEPEISGRRLQFKNLKLGPNSKIEIRLELLVLSSAGPGKHANIATVTDKDGNPVAPDAHAIVEIMSEPVFDCGEIIGTVFDDKNRNGYQDEGEKGLAGVRVATVKGWLITTDEYGRFHVPCAALPDQRIGSNFIMKLDTRTLPTGYRLTTENPRVVRLTAGKMTKLNFGASISRVVRLDLQDAAFEANRVELKKQWADNLPQLVEILKQEISVLRLSYKMAGNEQSLAKERMRHVRKQIADLWKRKGDNYPLEIETRVEVSK